MRYDLDLLSDFCREIGLAARLTDEQSLEVLMGDGAILCFQNDDREEDCLLGFLGTPWHTHWDLTFANAQGCHIEVDSLDLLTGLKSGQVLICERHVAGQPLDRWLIHSEYNDEFQYLGETERITVRRARAPDTSGPGG
jgi:hypothetical protein